MKKSKPFIKSRPLPKLSAEQQRKRAEVDHAAPTPQPVIKKPRVAVAPEVHYLTGDLGRQLAEQNDVTLAALKAVGHKPYSPSERVSIQPFTADPAQRRYFAEFVDDPRRQPVIWDSTKFRAAAPKKAMDEETKAYLKEKNKAKAMLHPKRVHKVPEDPVIKVGKGKSKLKAGSERAEIMAWLQKQKGEVRLTAMDQHFGKSMKGVLAKLLDMGWVSFS